MSQQRMALWTAEEIDEEFQGVDLSLAIGNYGQNELYDDGCYSSHP
jgi:translation initiation factor 3 subunit L